MSSEFAPCQSLPDVIKGKKKQERTLGQSYIANVAVRVGKCWRESSEDMKLPEVCLNRTMSDGALLQHQHQITASVEGPYGQSAEPKYC
uniref:Uncharacterized protein isoform X2 n=1 Tax=Nicotiana tabacum TaxID=4097 RepID=A0A1S4BT26_TOBAC|nr:PREDICTED: uncharacterized protein LOC107811592 isoform X2 [Nicotiana tabacum]